MKRSMTRLMRVVWAGGALAGVLGAWAREATADEPPFLARHALVTLAPGVSAAALAGEYGVSLGGSIPSRRTYLLVMPTEGEEPGLVETLRIDPRVERADLDYIVEDTDPNGTTQSIFLFRTVQQYAADASFAAIDGQSALQTADGFGVTVAVLDTGVDGTHPLLAGRVRSDGVNLLGGNALNTADVGDGVDNNGDGRVDEFVGHGTFIAGLITRIAPAAQILPVRVLDSDGGGSTFRLCEGVYFAVDRGARIINISLGTPGQPGVLRDAIVEAESRGVIVVASAGNDASADPRYPAGDSALGPFGITAVDAAGLAAPFSNYGGWVSLSAPGVGVVSLLPGGAYGQASGTSFAAPMAAGAAALVRSICPLAPPAIVRSILQGSATPINGLNPSYAGQLGSGMLNVGAALPAGAPLECSCDLTGDRRITIDDLYGFFKAPRDVNGNGEHDHADATALVEYLRSGEPATSARRP